MKSTDKFLIGIVVGIVLLVVAAFVVTLTRPEPTYQAEDTPEGVAHNYLLALQKKDYQRAYGYLSPTLKGYPVSAERFAENVEDRSWSFRLDTDTTLAIESARVTGNRAVVKVRESRFRGSDLFDSSQSTTVFDMELRLEDEWKIADSDYYFVWCWKRDDGC
ncbi:MAG: hypothetical protein E3J21_05670 [Anaerolineales bacterium]|nr:MAG: hypothetical protein E3J21_05670 [Anaerolineales bacterium]